MSDFLSAEYWNNRYLNDQFGWDLGQVSPPIKEFIDGTITIIQKEDDERVSTY